LSKSKKLQSINRRNKVQSASIVFVLFLEKTGKMKTGNKKRKKNRNLKIPFAKM
jgi:hypothetical protein